RERFPPQKFFQHCLSLDERRCPQVFTVEVQQVKRDEDAVTPTKKQVTKDWAASIIDTGDLAIEYCAFNLRCSAIQVARSAKPRKMFPFLEISSLLPAAICANARKPSIFNSKMY